MPAPTHEKGETQAALAALLGRRVNQQEVEDESV